VIDVIVLLKKAPALPSEAFRTAWAANNAGIYGAAAGCVRYSQCPVVSEPQPLPGMPVIAVSIDAIEKLAFADLAAFQATLRAHQSAWAELASIAAAMSIHAVQTDVVRDDGARPEVDAGLLQRMVLLKRMESLDRAQFFQHWRDVHAPLMRKVRGGARYYAQHRTIEEIDNPGGIASLQLGLDGFSETWYDDEAELRRAAASPEGQALAQDNLTFNGQTKRFFFTQTDLRQ